MFCSYADPNPSSLRQRQDPVGFAGGDRPRAAKESVAHDVLADST
jgi:hypothetical protein